MLCGCPVPQPPVEQPVPPTSADVTVRVVNDANRPANVTVVFQIDGAEVATISAAVAGGSGSVDFGPEDADRLDATAVFDDVSGTQTFSASFGDEFEDDATLEFRLVEPVVDSDGDGTVDDADNCPALRNPLQADGDGDGVGNACDNCPDAANRDQQDMDGDGTGDACTAITPAEDVDADDDGVVDEDDNCVDAANADQSDEDDDGIGDACDDDGDNDGVVNDDDNCPTMANANQADSDGDGIGNVCDLTPLPPGGGGGGGG
ncbi:MAG: hypothetical protein HOP29_19010, partial [Phycisphaerales bacterium]|nr:hypothetical protein [Phycisphaerales bacterium]